MKEWMSYKHATSKNPILRGQKLCCRRLYHLRIVVGMRLEHSRGDFLEAWKSHFISDFLVVSLFF